MSESSHDATLQALKDASIDPISVAEEREFFGATNKTATC